MVEKCRMPKLKGYKKRVQFSDNPVTIVQQQKIDFLLFFQKSSPIAFLYGFFRLPLTGKIKNGISAGLKVVSEIPYTLQRIHYSCKISMAAIVKTSFSPLIFCIMISL